MLHRPQVRRQARRKGAAIMEFIGVLPLYILLILGIWEGGRLFHAMQICSNAAREGARLASLGEDAPDPITNVAASSPSNIRTYVLNYIRNADPTINTTGITVEIKKVVPAGTGSEIPGTGDVDPSDRSIPTTNPLRVLRMDHLRVRVTIPYNNIAWGTNLPRITSVNQLVGVCNVRCMLDDVFVLDTNIPNQ
jgi:Flp pilus assembly protein TadG